MTPEALIALSPLIAVTGAATLVMLAIAVRRDYRLAFFLTLAGLLITLALLPQSLRLAPIQATELILIDSYAIFFSGLILAAALVVAILCYAYFRRTDAENEEIFVLLLTAVLGGMTLVSSSHFATFFIGLEILSVSLFPMIAYRVKDPRSLEAGIKYLMLSGVSSALLLFGMALIYSEAGVLSFQQLGQLSATLAANPLSLVGAILIIAALGFKLSLVPFHLWTPDVYQGAPAPVMAFVATVSKGAVFALLLRFLITGRGHQSETLLDILSVLGVASILAGNLLALLQNNLKRMLAYSSIAHMGYLLVTLVAGSVLHTELLAESVAFYLLAYVITTLGAVGVVSASSTDSRECEVLESYTGLFWRDPWLAGILTLNLLSLAGIPLTVGFVGKFYVFATSVSAALWTLVGAVVIGSGIGLYYYLRVVLVMLNPPTDAPQPAGPGAILTRLTLTSLALVLLWSGIYPQPFMAALQAIAQTLT
jgi:NADH-quinone oxidoreductase subunit N